VGPNAALRCLSRPHRPHRSGGALTGRPCANSVCSALKCNRWSSGFSLRKWTAKAEQACSGAVETCVPHKTTASVKRRKLRPELQRWAAPAGLNGRSFGLLNLIPVFYLTL
jgi:hypothetical protein